jgi:predicted nucleic acid-binding protein
MIRALIDTGAVYALVAATDRHHSDAVKFTKDWLQRKGLFVLSDLVFVEAMTLMKRRLGQPVAIRAGSELRENPVFAWVALTPALEKEKWSVFQSYDDKEWSYTDCELLVLSSQLRVLDVFSFDDRFRQMPGIKRLPRWHAGAADRSEPRP